MKLYGLGLRVLCERGVLTSLLEVEYRHVSIRTGCRCRSMGECWERLDSRSGELEEQHDALAEGWEKQEAQPVATDACHLNRRWRRRLQCGTRARTRSKYIEWDGRRKIWSQGDEITPPKTPHRRSHHYMQAGYVHEVLCNMHEFGIVIAHAGAGRVVVRAVGV